MLAEKPPVARCFHLMSAMDTQHASRGAVPSRRHTEAQACLGCRRSSWLDVRRQRRPELGRALCAMLLQRRCSCRSGSCCSCHPGRSRACWRLLLQHELRPVLQHSILTSYINGHTDAASKQQTLCAVEVALALVQTVWCLLCAPHIFAPAVTFSGAWENSALYINQD